MKDNNDDKILTGYRKEIFRSKCDTGAQTLHCYAHLNEDIGDVIPYLNATLGGFSCSKEPPSVTFKAHGKLITVHGDKIAVNALKDETQADKILDWLQREINDAWLNRGSISPSYQSASQPVVFEIFKLLPMTNCKACGAPTCLVFATQVAEGAKVPEDCPSLSGEKMEKLESYLSPFSFM
jgi:ArsR family metal-binding transcriptional regulator